MTEDALPFARVIARPLRVSPLLREAAHNLTPPAPVTPSPFGRQAPAPRPIGGWVRLDSVAKSGVARAAQINQP